jgi:hypothetical protein
MGGKLGLLGGLYSGMGVISDAQVQCLHPTAFARSAVHPSGHTLPQIPLFMRLCTSYVTSRNLALGPLSHPPHLRGVHCVQLCLLQHLLLVRHVALQHLRQPPLARQHVHLGWGRGQVKVGPGRGEHGQSIQAAPDKPTHEPHHN